MEEKIINKVSASQLVTLDLEQLRPSGDRVAFDMKDILFQGLILKEKDFRAFVKSNDWSIYATKHVAIYCSSDAIVPQWAYMLLAVMLQPIAITVVFGSLEALEERLYLHKLNALDWSSYEGAKVVVKGCGKFEIPSAVYLEVASRLRPIAQSIMFGEPCSTVPVFKRRPA